MRIPPGFPQDVKTAHGFVTVEEVFEQPTLEVSHVGMPIGRRRTLEKHETLGAPSGPHIHAFLEDTVRIPEVQHLFLAFFEIKH